MRARGEPRVGAGLLAALVSVLALEYPAAAASASYRTLADWRDGFNGEIAISNDSDSGIQDWQLEFEWDRTLDPVWNARVMRRDGNRWVLGPETWNRTIAAGARVVIGMSGSPGQVTAGPRNMTVTGANTPPPSPVRVALLVTAQFEAGFTATILIANTGSREVSDWRLGFEYDAAIESVWNAGLERNGSSYVLTAAESVRQIPPGGAVAVGFSASGSPLAPPRGCVFNGAPCEFVSADEPTPPPPPATAEPMTRFPPPVPGAISIPNVDGQNEATQLTIPLGPSRFALNARVAAPKFSVAAGNPSVVSAAIVEGNILELTGIAPGRSALRIVDSAGNAARYIGVRVGGGSAPDSPPYVALGSVSEDTQEHLDFWREFQDGLKGRRMDYRYIYLNGGPLRGWSTWSPLPGGRAIDFIRNSRRLGMIPVFVFYNIPQDSESFAVAVANSRSHSYMTAWFRNLGLLLEIVNRESPGDPVGIVLEPDFLGYLAQGLRLPPSQIPAAASAVYDSGLLTAGTAPRFPDTLRGLVEAINYSISSRCGQCYFGWQMNLWASPAGGWRTPIPAKGIVRVTDDLGIATGRERIRAEASAIAEFYATAGVAAHGARFFSIDKYGLDAVGFEPAAASDPASSTWFWNADHWGNYLTFVRAASETLRLPAILWQVPVGRINRSHQENPYAPGFRFPDLTNGPRNYEDSAAAWFLGDRFSSNGARRQYFASNRAQDPLVSAGTDSVSWEPHMADAARAGVVAILFGAGVAESTSGVGSPPSDGHWWIVKAQRYLASPVPVAGREPVR